MQRLFLSIFLAASLACAQGCATSAVSNRAAWEQSKGGLAPVVREGRVSVGRAQAALARVVPEGCSLRLRINVLKNDAPAAHSFKDGAVYVSTGLLERLSDDELSAVIAHELGHLMIDGILATEPAALSGAPATLAARDVELHADLLARKVLSGREIAPAALTTALRKVAEASRCEPFYGPVMWRVKTLAGLDQNSDN